MLFVIATYAGISAYNVSMSKRRLNKANKKITCKLSEVGYEMDKKTSKNICHNISYLTLCYRTIFPNFILFNRVKKQ